MTDTNSVAQATVTMKNFSDSLINRISGGLLGDDGMVKVSYVINIIRQHMIDNTGTDVPVSKVDEEIEQMKAELRKKFEAATPPPTDQPHEFQDVELSAKAALWGMPDCSNVDKMIDRLRPFLRSPKRVPVSLEKCGDALAIEMKAQNLCADKDIGKTKYKTLVGVDGITCTRRLSKAVLDAAGVKYHE